MACPQGYQTAVTDASNEDVRAGDTDREAVARQLATAASEGRITVAELENRLVRTHDALTYGDLHEIVDDLPGAAEPVEHTIPEHTVPETLHISAALRDARRRGRWTAPQRIMASAGVGSVYLDFTKAVIDHDEVTVDARPNWGDVRLIVPEGCTVTTEESVPGSSVVRDLTSAKPRPDCPRIHIVARPGQGSIIVRHPRRGLRPSP